jgi:hypothetical protein
MQKTHSEMDVFHLVLFIKSTKWKLFVSHPKILNLKTKFLNNFHFWTTTKKNGINFIGGNQYIQENYQRVGTQLADFKLIQNDLSVASLSDFGKKTRD